MKIVNVTLGMLVLLGAIASDSALAGRGHSGRSGHHGHSGSVTHSGHIGRPARIGTFLAIPLIAPLYFPPSGYYPIPPSATPETYVEQESALSTPGQQPNYWYYCAEAKAYYPYVDACPAGWQREIPAAPAPY